MNLGGSPKPHKESLLPNPEKEINISSTASKSNARGNSKSSGSMGKKVIQHGTVHKNTFSSANVKASSMTLTSLGSHSRSASFATHNKSDAETQLPPPQPPDGMKIEKVMDHMEKIKSGSHSSSSSNNAFNKAKKGVINPNVDAN